MKLRENTEHENIIFSGRQLVGRGQEQSSYKDSVSKGRTEHRGKKLK